MPKSDKIFVAALAIVAALGVCHYVAKAFEPSTDTAFGKIIVGGDLAFRGLTEHSEGAEEYGR